MSPAEPTTTPTPVSDRRPTLSPARRPTAARTTGPVQRAQARKVLPTRAVAPTPMPTLARPPAGARTVPPTIVMPTAAATSIKTAPAAGSSIRRAVGQAPMGIPPGPTRSRRRAARVARARVISRIASIAVPGPAEACLAVAAGYLAVIARAAALADSAAVAVGVAASGAEAEVDLAAAGADRIRPR